MKPCVAAEGEVVGVGESLPFGEGEEGAPGAVAEGDGFVGAEGLRGEGVVGGPVVVGGEVVEVVGAVGEVVGFPFGDGVGYVVVKGDVHGVGTGVFGLERGVEVLLFDHGE